MPVTLLADTDIAGWLRDFLPRLASAATPARPQPGSSAEAVASIVSANLERVQLTALSDPWEILLSPIWERGPTGAAVRRAFLAPRSMRAHYFEGAAREVLQRSDLAAVMAAMAPRQDARHPIADLEALYCSPEAPIVEVAKVWTPELRALSLRLADAARRARVGATVEQLSTLELSPEQSEALARIESDFMTAMRDAPVDELVKALRDPTRQGGDEQPRPWWKLW